MLKKTLFVIIIFTLFVFNVAIAETTEAESYRNRGLKYFDEKQYELAITELERAISLGANDYEAIKALNDIYKNKGDTANQGRIMRYLLETTKGYEFIKNPLLNPKKTLLLKKGWDAMEATDKEGVYEIPADISEKIIGVGLAPVFMGLMRWKTAYNSIPPEFENAINLLKQGDKCSFTLRLFDGVKVRYTDNDLYNEEISNNDFFESKEQGFLPFNIYVGSKIANELSALTDYLNKGGIGEVEEIKYQLGNLYYKLSKYTTHSDENTIWLKDKDGIDILDKDIICENDSLLYKLADGKVFEDYFGSPLYDFSDNNYIEKGKVVKGETLKYFQLGRDSSPFNWITKDDGTIGYILKPYNKLLEYGENSYKKGEFKEAKVLIEYAIQLKGDTNETNDWLKRINYDLQIQAEKESGEYAKKELYKKINAYFKKHPKRIFYKKHVIAGNLRNGMNWDEVIFILGEPDSESHTEDGRLGKIDVYIWKDSTGLIPAYSVSLHNGYVVNWTQY